MRNSTRRHFGHAPSGRRLRIAALMVSAAATAAWVVPAAASASAPNPSTPAGHIAGIVPPHNATHSACCGGGGSNLSYHGGAVMQTNVVYTIYWVPSGYSVSGTYNSLINGFFNNLNAAQGSTAKNVYAIDTQYYSYNGTYTYISNNSSLGGTYVDTDPLPSSGCTDNDTSVCVTDAQIQAEISKAIAANHWTPSSSALFLMLTAKGIGSCGGSSCAFTQYCAYHGYDGSGSSTIYYANMPYADTVPAACDSGQYPNADPAADSEINIISHEHNETITDQKLNAWYDRRGYEIGDKCAWNFGAVIGNNGNGSYNQVINGADYYVQQEWSDKNSACALHL
jgi:hypothetical protein